MAKKIRRRLVVDMQSARPSEVLLVLVQPFVCDPLAAYQYRTGCMLCKHIAFAGFS